MDIRPRILNGVANTGLGGQMHREIIMFLGVAFLECGLVAYVDLLEPKARKLVQQFETFTFKIDIIIIVYIINSVNSPTKAKQPAANMIADKPGCSRDAD